MLLAGAVLTINLFRPWVGYHDFNGASLSLAARNFLRYGFLATKFAPVMNPDTVSPDRFAFSLHHPPLVPVLAAISFGLFGVHEASARLVPIAASLGSVLFLYLLARDLYGRRLALLAAFLFALTPLHAYFGRMLSEEPITEFFILGSVFFYQRWSASRDRRAFGFSLALYGIGMWAGWAAYYLGALVPCHHLLARGKRVKLTLLFPALALVAFGLFLAQVGAAGQGPALHDLWTQFLWRVGNASQEVPNVQRAAVPGFSLLQWVARDGRWAFYGFTPVLLLLASGWAVGAWRAFRAEGRPLAPDLVVGLLYAVGLINVLFFKQASYIHEFWLFYLAPPLALSAAAGTDSLRRFLGHWRGERLGQRLTVFILLAFVLLSVLKLRSYHRITEDRQVLLGQMIRRQTRPGQAVILAGWTDTRVAYYAERNLIPAGDSPHSLGRFQKREEAIGMIVVDTRNPAWRDFQAFVTARCEPKTFRQFVYADFHTCRPEGQGQQL